MTAQEMFENLGYEKEDMLYHITYTSKYDNHRNFDFYKEIPKKVFTSAYVLDSEELKACLKQLEEFEKQ